MRGRMEGFFKIYRVAVRLFALLVLAAILISFFVRIFDGGGFTKRLFALLFGRDARREEGAGFFSAEGDGPRSDEQTPDNPTKSEPILRGKTPETAESGAKVGAKTGDETGKNAKDRVKMQKST